MNPQPLGRRQRRVAARRVRRRVWLAVVVVVAGAIAMIPYPDLVVGGLVPQVQAVAWVAMLALALAAVVSAAFRAWAAAVVIAVAAVIGTAPLLVPPGGTSCAAGSELGVFSLNVELAQADLDAVVAEVTERAPEVVVLLEVDEPMISAFQATAIGSRYTSRTGPVSDGYAGSVILSTLPLTEVEGPEDPSAFDQPVARVDLPDREQAVIAAVHPYPPVRGSADRWQRSLRLLGAWHRDVLAPHLVMAGDFNAGTAHPAFRSLAGGLDHAAAASGWWPMPTWPATGPVPPFANIDHVLTRGTQATSFDRIDIPGTDHLAVATTLRLCRGS
ncbi:endonuclease/exonuclease/phosphatase family protein [Microbacterium sp.]|uniref:endonuclease/exonuclease/phosphatase family protein n=1 Tax=Microbacterium sp. TaxID=51671 RepID=UPI003A862C87